MTDNDKPAAPAEPCCCEWFTCDKPCSPRADRFKQAWLAAIDEAQPIDVAAPAAPAPDAERLIAQLIRYADIDEDIGEMVERDIRAAADLIAAQAREIAALRAQLNEALAECDGLQKKLDESERALQRYRINVNVGQGVTPDPQGEWVRYVPSAPAQDADKAKIAADLMNAGCESNMADAVSSLVAAQARELADLRAQLAEQKQFTQVARDDRDDHQRECIKALARAERAEAERDALRADAERYRWLRPRLYSIDFDYGVERTSVIAFEAPQNQPLGPGIQLDAAIDAARNEKP